MLGPVYKYSSAELGYSARTCIQILSAELGYSELVGSFNWEIFVSVDYIATANSLTTKEGRRAWENTFYSHYVQPVLEDLEQVLTNTVDTIAKDDKQGNICTVKCRSNSQSTL